MATMRPVRKGFVSGVKPWEDLIQTTTWRTLRAEMTHAAMLRIPSTRDDGPQVASTGVHTHRACASPSRNGAFEFPIHEGH